MYKYELQDWKVSQEPISKLRVEVWKPLAEPGARGLKLTHLIETLDDDQRTIHIACLNDEEIVGAVRLTFDYLSGSILQMLGARDIPGNALLTRLVVSEAHRYRGIAKRLELECLQRAIYAGQQWLWVEAAPTTLEPLVRLGFEELLSYQETEAIFVRQKLTIIRKRLN